MRFLLRSVLVSEGYITLEAENGQVALAQLVEHPEIDLLVTDLDMPIMSGLELLRALAFRTALPKLAISAASSAPPLAELGVSAYFGKPLELSHFKQTVRRLVGSEKAAKVKKNPITHLLP